MGLKITFNKEQYGVLLAEILPTVINSEKVYKLSDEFCSKRFDPKQISKRFCINYE